MTLGSFPTPVGQDDLRGPTDLFRNGQHFFASESPLLCHCGKEFARLYTLRRHIQNSQKNDLPEYPCPECTRHQGKNGFKRKDHLRQHLKHGHNYDDDRLVALFPSREARRFEIPVCHNKNCEYYRGPEFKELGIGEQEKNRPFEKQSDYTQHMKNEHDWSPHPCTVPGCSKVNGKGFFSPTAFEKHCKEKHPGVIAVVQKPHDRVAEKVRCDWCQNWIARSYLTQHQGSVCKGKVACDYCNKTMKHSQLDCHKWGCKAEVACIGCSKLRLGRNLKSGKCGACYRKRKSQV
ncbi:hypothetical protein GGR58DRAFT_479319 [Xylaria digitata]|nr:hypothetical protein GGR58DRAFT_479319 [Xylaria digitata]